MWDSLKIDNILFILIDFQEKFFKILQPKHVELVRKNILLLVKMFGKMDIPMIGTEHYVKGLGHTDDSVLSEWTGKPFTAKITFSCCGCESFLSDLVENTKPVVVISGLETHICVLQTVLDLLKRDYTVIVLKDACLSSSTLKWENGLHLMREAGAYILNTETLLFYLLQRADTPLFKDMVGLLKE